MGFAEAAGPMPYRANRTLRRPLVASVQRVARARTQRKSKRRRIAYITGHWSDGHQWPLDKEVHLNDQ